MRAVRPGCALGLASVSIEKSQQKMAGYPQPDSGTIIREADWCVAHASWDSGYSGHPCQELLRPADHRDLR